MNTQLNFVQKKDIAIGTVIALAMGTFFTIAGGLPLMITFVVSLGFTWFVFFYSFKKKTKLPELSDFMPLFFLTLSWQFIHFSEEFMTGFRTKFPGLYNSAEYSNEKFVLVNMGSYAVFTLACVLAFKRQLNFLLVPVLFFIVYGAIGNAIAHSWWGIYTKGYFPGLFTAQLYWVLGPMLLYKLMPSKKSVIIFILIYAAVLVTLLTMFAKQA